MSMYYLKDGRKEYIPDYNAEIGLRQLINEYMGDSLVDLFDEILHDYQEDIRQIYARHFEDQFTLNINITMNLVVEQVKRIAEKSGQEEEAKAIQENMKTLVKEIQNLYQYDPLA